MFNLMSVLERLAKFHQSKIRIASRNQAGTKVAAIAFGRGRMQKMGNMAGLDKPIIEIRMSL